MFPRLHVGRFDLGRLAVGKSRGLWGTDAHLLLCYGR